jgi:penicillin-binding protein 1C
MKWGLLTLVALAAVVATWQAVSPKPSPLSFESVRAAYCPSDVRLLDRHGVVLHELRVDPRRRRLAWTPLAAVSPALTDALLASEDRRFLVHGGVDWRAVGAALWQRLRGNPPRGASTLSMQVAALLEPSLQRGDAPRTLADKWRQMRAAWALEQAWTKQQILEAYVNLVTFRGELQGVGAAADILFGKAPHGLTHAESLVLAALVRSPNADRQALMRRVELLSRTRALRQAQGERMGLVAAESDSVRPEPVEGRALHTSGTSSELEAAIDRALAAPRGSGPRVALAPHAARRLLPQTGPAPCADTPSTLDAATQRYAADSLRRHLLAIRDRSVRDAAVLVADNASGEVLAYVAASGDLSRARQVDGIQARRQAGSTLKPFLYARAIDRRVLTAASLLDDSPLEIAAGSGLFRPRNYDDQFRGLVSLRTALAASLNVPAVRALLLVGADDFAQQLRQLGFAGVRQPGDYYGPSLALGSADVTLWQLTNAYRTLAGGGVWTPLRMQPAPSPAVATSPRVFSAAAAFVVADVLADRDSRSVTFGLESPLATRFWSAVKTGTSKDMRDNWCIGFSRRYTVGVWVGNFSGEPMRDVSGITGAAPIWEDVMSWLHRDLPSDAPVPPPGVRAAAAGFADAAEPPRREWFLDGTEPLRAEAVRASAPRIIAPSDGSIIAVDPDIPAPRQRVAFAAADAGDATRWLLDGTDLGPAATITLWPPVPGAHVLTLVDAGARPLGSVRFEVRGARQPAA